MLPLVLVLALAPMIRGVQNRRPFSIAQHETRAGQTVAKRISCVNRSEGYGFTRSTKYSEMRAKAADRCGGVVGL